MRQMVQKTCCSGSTPQSSDLCGNERQVAEPEDRNSGVAGDVDAAADSDVKNGVVLSEVHDLWRPSESQKGSLPPVVGYMT